MSHLNNASEPGRSRSRLFLLLAFSAGCLCAWLFNRDFPPHRGVPEVVHQDLTCDYSINRINGFERVRPILSVEQKEKSPHFDALSKELEHFIDSMQRLEIVDQVSVYLREFDHGEWFSLNPKGQYHPASLMKVALLMCYLKTAESNPALLRQKWLYPKNHPAPANVQYYAGPSIQEGKSYTLHELLYYMIAYSDNSATELLASRSDPNQLKKLFSSFGLPEPVGDKDSFVMTADEYSIFLKAIYNSAYLSPEFSEYAAELLSNCTFREGFVNGFPDDTKLWHKFGEWRSLGQDHELHESGVFFVKDKPYLLTVMTRGKDTPALAEMIRDVAKKVYEKVSPP